MWFLRLFSLLEIIKCIMRITCNLSIDKNCNRKSIPAWVTETYFCSTSFICIGLNWLCIKHNFTEILTFYLLIESSVWLLYFSIFRCFSERDEYKANNELYHLNRLFVVFIIQTLYLSYLLNISFSDIISTVIGVDDKLIKNSNNWNLTFLSSELTLFLRDWISILLHLMGMFYFTISLSIILSRFPDEKKKDNITQETQSKSISNNKCSFLRDNTIS